MDLAPALLGCVIRTDSVAIRLTEVEAYEGDEDPGSHAFRGPTPRTVIMFGEAGRAYVYLSYGMHHCVNVVCGPSGTASAVLLRAGDVIEGEAAARSRRDHGRGHAWPHRDLARGPARLTSALGINRNENGTDLCDPSSPLRLETGPELRHGQVSSGPRVGVSGAGGDGTAYPWRFWITGDPCVSAYRPGKPRRPVPPGPGR